MDEARKRTDKILADTERRVGEIYASDPSLLRIKRRYEKYMEQVWEATEGDYRAFKEAGEEDKAEKKKAYTKRLRELTLGSKGYQKLVAEIARVMAEVNQKALDLVNAEMTEIYTINYNQLAVDCRKEGIEVNGKA